MLYLVFNEGYSGDVDLAAEAIRLTRQLAALTDDEEAAGLLALMLLHHARRAGADPGGRQPGAAGRAGPSRWDTALIAEGVDDPAGGAGARPARASTRPRPRSPPCTPTPRAPRRPTGCRSSSWYDELLRLTGSPVVRLNRAVAVGEADGPRAGLAALAEVDPDLPRHAAVAAYLHEKPGDRRGRPRSTPRPPVRRPTLAERDHLARQAARLNHGDDRGTGPNHD